MRAALRLLALLLVAASPASAAAPPGAADIATAGERQLRDLLLGRSLPYPQRQAAIAALRARFPSDVNEAAAMNAEARDLLDDRQAEAAYDRFTQVRGRFAGRADAAVTVEIVRAMQGQILARETIESRTLASGPAGLATMLDSASMRLRRELVAQFRDPRDPAIRDIVAWQRFSIAEIERIAAGQADPAPLLALTREYGTVPGLENLTATIYFHLAWGNPDRALALRYFEEIPRRFRSSSDPAVRQLVDDAYSNIVSLLEELGRNREAARVRRDYERRLGYALPPQPDR